jgi:hypothetical protein
MVQKIYEWMPFAFDLCYFFKKGNFRLVSLLFKVPQLDLAGLLPV